MGPRSPPLARFLDAGGLGPTLSASDAHGEDGMIEVTESASSRIKELLDRDGKLGSHGLRLKVVGGGCSGLQYQLSFDDQQSENDHVIEAGGVKVLVDEKSALYLVGVTLDFVDTLQETGFKIENPNATTTCGCGESFAA
jgi:iron-sulfur cluster assembly protein